MLIRESREDPVRRRFRVGCGEEEKLCYAYSSPVNGRRERSKSEYLVTLADR